MKNKRKAKDPGFGHLVELQRHLDHVLGRGTPAAHVHVVRVQHLPLLHAKNDDVIRGKDEIMLNLDLSPK
jgi:hypothetical protein